MASWAMYKDSLYIAQVAIISLPLFACIAILFLIKVHLLLPPINIVVAVYVVC